MNQVIEICDAVRGTLVLIAVMGTVQNLVFKAGVPRLTPLFAHSVNHATVGSLGGDPIEDQFEALICFFGDEVYRGCLWIGAKGSIDHVPSLRWEKILLIGSKSISGMAIEKSFPLSCLEGR